MARAAFTACVLSSAPPVCGAVAPAAYTNHAGHAVHGTLQSVSGGVAVISSRAYPLSAFPERERARMRALLEVPEPLPPDLEALRKSLRERVLRVNALEAAGARDRESAAAARAKLQAVWTRALEADASLSPAARRNFREL